MADMPDVGAYGIQAPGPNPSMMQVGMPAQNAPIPTYQTPQFPQAADYNVPQSVPVQTPVQQPSRGLPTLADFISNAEVKSGKPIDKKTFDDMAGWYKTNVLTQALWGQKGATKDKVTAEVAAYDDAVNREAHKRFTNQAAPVDTNMGSAGAFTTAAKGGLERGAAGLSMLLGGVTNLGGLAPNKLGDYLLSQANPEQQDLSKTDLASLSAQRDKLLTFYANNPKAQADIRAQLDPKIAALQQSASGQNLVERGNENIANAYDSGHNIASTLGVAAGQLLPFILTRGGGAAALAGTAGATAASNVATNAASQLGRGDSLGQVETQALPDAALETLMAYLPTKFAGGAIARGLKGAGSAGGVATVQQIIDKAINSKNEVSPESVGVASALGAGLALLHGSDVQNILSKLGKKKPTLKTPPSGTAVPKSEGAPLSAAADEVEASMTPEQAYKDLMNSNVTTEGLPDQEFNRLNNNIGQKAEMMAKKFKPSKSFDSPEDLIGETIKYAKALTKDKFYQMTPEQREELIGNLASWFGKRAKVDNNDISNAILGMRSVLATENATTTIPTEPTAETQVPEEVAQTPTQQSQQTVIQTPETNTYTPVAKYDPIWQAASDSNTPVSQLPQEMQVLAAQVRNGRIPNRQAFDTVLQTAEAKAGNKLKAQPKQQADTTSLHPPENQTAQTQVADTRKVSDVLASRSTKTSEINLRKQLRAMLKASGAKDADLDKLKNSSVKNLLEKAKTTKNKQILAKTNIEPVENPDEITSKPVSKNKLKKQTNTQTNEATDAASLYAAKNNIPYAFMSSISKAYDLAPEEVGAVWNRYKEAGLVKLDKKNPQNYALKNDSLTKEDMVRSTLDDAREAGEVEGSPPPKNQAPAKGNVGANKQTPLEKLLQERLGDRLPKERLDDLHNAIETAQTGDKNNLTDYITGLQDSGDITKNEAKWLKSLPDSGVAHDLVDESRAQELGAQASNKIDSDAASPIIPKRVRIRAVPLGAGLSRDGSTLYVDSHIPESINVPRSDGTTAHVVLYDPNDSTVGGLVVHEGNEFPQMHERGKNYSKAHDENANSAEDAYYKAKYGVSRAAVDKALKPYLDAAEENSANNSDIPHDLDTKPYEDSGKTHLLNSKVVENNASGESSGSLEAQGRVKSEREAGRTRAVIRHNGTVEPVAHTVDAPNVHARAGEVYVQRGIGRNPDEWTILSHGDDMSRDAAMGKVNKAKQALDSTHEEMQASRNQKDQAIPEHNISPEEFETLYSDRTKEQENNLPQRSERIAPLSVKREVDGIIQDIREGSNVQEAGAKLKSLSDKIAQRNLERNLKSMRGVRRGPEWVKARLQRLIADSDPNSDHYAAAKMAQWLLNQNPNIADSLGISIHKMESGEAGRFNPISRVLHLSSSNLNKTTGLHELLHASERLLPSEIQDKLRGEYIGRIQNKLKKTADPWARAYLKNAIRNFVHPNRSDQLAMMDILKNHRAEVPANEYYKYFDPSEYWAEEGSSILARRHGADSWIGKVKQWLSEFAQHVKKVFGLDNNSGVVKGLNKMLKTTEGENTMLNKGDQEARAIDKEESKDYDDEQVGDDPTDEELGYQTDKEADIDPNMEKEVVYNKKAKDLGDYTETDKLIEQLANADHGLEKSVQFGYREGVLINEDNNVFDAAYQKRGVTANTHETDRYEVVNPADDWVHENYSKFANSTPEAYDRINDFYGTKNLLERAQTAWWLESPLDGGAEIDRASILEKVVDGDITPDKARAQLQKLAKDHSILDWEDYAESKGTDIEALQNKLKELKDQGVDENTLAEHNKLTQNIRDRLQDNLLKSGDTTESDPYVKLYDWKWYVPLKGSPFASGARVDGNFDLIPEKNIALARLNRQMAVMKGRNSLTDKPYFRLLVDLARSADRIGHKIVMDKFYNLLTTEDGSGQLALKKYGAKIDVWHGFQKKGYTDAKGKYVDRLKAPANGVIINDGDTHYIVTLPHNSPLLRGLIQMDNIKTPSPKLRKIGRVTNTLARLYTTLDPRWVVSVGFARDITYVPFSIAVTRFNNPLQAIPFITRYIPEIMGAYKALPTILPQIAGNEAALRTMAEANPEGWAAMTMRYKAAGGSNYFTKGFDIGGVERELLSRYQDTNGVIDLTKYGAKKVMDYTGNFANSLEQLTRVAMFKQLLKEGMSDTESAVQVRKIMDYEQSGTHGRLINSWLAFFRVGATGTDVIRRAFTKPGGGLDYAKFAKWQAFMGALGYLSYMGAMSFLGKDDDGKYKIQKINPDQLTSKAFFPVGDKIGSLNLGLGIPQFLLAPGILAAALEQGHIDERTALKSYLDMLERNGPTSPGGALGNNPTDYAASAFFGFVPTAIRPIIDTSRNTSSFSSPIHNSDPDRNKYNSDQGYPNTPKEYKDIASWIREHSGNTIDIFPEDIKYWIESYGGAPATDFTKWAFENGNVAAGGQAPLGRLAGSFYVDTSHYMSRDLFDTLDTLTDSSKRYNHLVSSTIHQDGVSRDQAKAKVQEVVDRDPNFAKRLKAYKELLKAHKDYNKQVNTLRDDKLLSDTRKQLVRKQADSQLRKAIEKAQTVIDATGKQ